MRLWEPGLIGRPQYSFSKIFWIGLAACVTLELRHEIQLTRLTSMNFSRSLSKLARSSFRFL